MENIFLRLRSATCALICAFTTLCLRAEASTPEFAHEGYYYRIIDGHLMIVNVFAVPGSDQKYDVIKLSTHENALEIDQISFPEKILTMADVNEVFAKLYVPSLLAFVEQFVARELAERGRTTAIEAIGSERRFVRVPATWVIVSDHNNLENIHAVGRVARRKTVHDEIDVESLGRRTKAHLGEFDPEFMEVLRLHHPFLLDLEDRLKFNLPEELSEDDVALGFQHKEWAELKTLVQRRHPPERFVNLLFYALAVNDQHRRPSPDSAIPFLQYRKTVGLTTLKTLTTQFTTHFALETDSPGIFKSKGFAVHKHFPEKNTYVMTTNVVEFNRHVSVVSEGGHLFTETLRNPAEWIPYPLLPPFAYAQYLTDRRTPPAHFVSGIPIRCVDIIRTGGIPFRMAPNYSADIRFGNY